ncbi:hypothetical protein NIIDNTM18_09970 [Mycolicibacterium litorale]|uniref:Uncharacterized protein n=1 Tax=Mycolicibacterium litorale TaxID=758802 RepID=A0A6S6NZU6_9MYCO|nr:hypothetical protein [Mycolicibacterium litorale]BCI51719.1 hypothetical protein NIIDNTM18_09970 [Mycolicibacterium litorale]
MIRALAVVNNHISLNMLLADLGARGIAPNETFIIGTRQMDLPDNLGGKLDYPGKHEMGVLGQRRFIGFYRHATRILNRQLASPALQHLYVINNDNLLTSHLLETALRDGREVTVVVEGLMNFLDSGVHNLDSWRLKIKPVLTRLLGLRYVTPVGHQSGAFHPAVRRVVSFSRDGLRAPPEKVVLRRWPIEAAPSLPPDPDVGLVVHTALARFMSEAQYRVFAEGYANWISAQNFRRLYTKPHPRSEDPLLESLLPPHEVINDDRPIEDMAGDIAAGVVVGPGTTPLVTLKLMRPELRCIDFGADYYVPIVYQGGIGATPLFEAAGVERVPFTEGAN